MKERHSEGEVPAQGAIRARSFHALRADLAGVVQTRRHTETGTGTETETEGEKERRERSEVGGGTTLYRMYGWIELD